MTMPSVTIAMPTSPTAPTMTGYSPCLRMARKSVEQPDARKRQQEGPARQIGDVGSVCSFENAPKVASSDTAKKAEHEFRKLRPQDLASLLSTVRACPVVGP